MATPQTAGTATPMELDPEQAAQSLKVSLADLSAKATAFYAHKNYDESAEVYAQAAEMQAEMNGEMSPDNAEILFLYGRALFKVGQSKSDVLGGKAPDAKKPKPTKPVKKSKPANGATKQKNGNGQSAAAAGEAKVEDFVAEVDKAIAEVDKAIAETDEAVAEADEAVAEADEAVAEVDKVVGEAAKALEVTVTEDEPPAAKKPLFHFEGDENFEDSDEEEDAEEGEEDEEEDDDLAVAFEILDLARVLFEKKLELLSEPESDKGKEVSEGDSPAIKHIKERLGDTHDLLAEISLENERYPNAITDSRASLRYKKELYPEESEIIAEAHFKLSLALEFASVTKSSDDDDAPAEGDKNGAAGVVDQALRDEAAVELEAAIQSTRLKLQSKEVELATLHNPEDNDLTRHQIADVKEVIADMEQRLVELKKPPIDINQALGMPAPAAASANQASEEVKRNANDLTGLVRKKRKAEDVPVEESAKKVKETESVN